MDKFESDLNRILGCLTLANGSSCGIAASDALSLNLVRKLIEVMQLESEREPSHIVLARSNREISNAFGRHNLLENMKLSTEEFDDNPKVSINVRSVTPSSLVFDVAHFITKNPLHDDTFVIELICLAQVVLDHTDADNALLIHGALVELDGRGVLLAGPGGVGKSTACARLPSPWLAHCDDTTVLVRDEHGDYWAHPWPTWSHFLYGGTGGSWAVESPVRLEALFFLWQAEEDQADPCGEAEAVCLMLETVEQGSRLSSRDRSKADARTKNLKRFEIVCELVKIIPSYRLGVTKTGAYWLEIEGILGRHDWS